MNDFQPIKSTYTNTESIQKNKQCATRTPLNCGTPIKQEHNKPCLFCGQNINPRKAIFNSVLRRNKRLYLYIHYIRQKTHVFYYITLFWYVAQFVIYTLSHKIALVRQKAKNCLFKLKLKMWLKLFLLYNKNSTWFLIKYYYYYFQK